MTDSEVAEGRRLLAEATNRPWTSTTDRRTNYPKIMGPNYRYPDKDNVLGYLGRMSQADLALVVFAVNNLDTLLSGLQRTTSSGAIGPDIDV